MSEPILTVANLLTILRMGLAPFLVILILSGRYGWAFGMFVVAALSDLLDGAIARWGRQRTKLGATLDPVADKILLSSAFVVLTWGGNLLVSIPAWLTVLSLLRDAIIVFSVAVINLVLGARVFEPSLLGKLSTASQLLTVGVVILLNALGRDLAALEVLFQLTGLLVVASGMHYVYLVSAHGGNRRNG